MKNLCAVILAVSLGTLGSVAALAQTGNTAYGTGALANNATGNYNSAFGVSALYSSTTGGNGTAFGYEALYNNTTGNQNMAIGAFALYSNTIGSFNTADGIRALYNNTTGNNNSASGLQALIYNTTGSYNTGTGVGALQNNSTGNYNIGIGYAAGNSITTGSYNIDIGTYGLSGDSNVTRIGTAGNQTSFYAAGISGVAINDGVEVFINSSGQLGTVNSSIRFKQDVHDMASASDRLFQLRPVTYRYKEAYADGSRPIEYGLIAEEVAKVYPDLVVQGADGKIQTVQYQKLTPMLLNELQKQHRLFEQQQQTIGQQAEAIEKLKRQQAETVQMLEKRLAALETARTSDRSAVRLTANALQTPGSSVRF